MTSPERIRQLLPLANGDELPSKTLRQLVLTFLNQFEASGMRLQPDAGMWDAYSHATDTELKAVQEKVQKLFRTGFLFDRPRHSGTEHIRPEDIALPLSFPSLRFAAFSSPRGRLKTDARFTLRVDGNRLRDLVPFLAMWLLTTEDIAVSRCQAPESKNWRQRCDRFLLWSGRGRPPKVCGSKCADRVKAKRKFERARDERTELRAFRKGAVTQPDPRRSR
jgi:hypothetical protein